MTYHFRRKSGLGIKSVSALGSLILESIAPEEIMRLEDYVSAPVFATACLVMLACAVHPPAPADSSEVDSSAIKQVCADFSESFTHHDAHGVAMTFAEDADFANMNGRHTHGRAEIEKWFAGLFRGNLRDSVRTDTVRSIRFYGPELAEAEADTVITGTKTADGSELPPRKGLMIVLMTKQGGRWLIGSFHEAEYPAPRGGAANTTAPASSN